jgi:hypothetical protein
MRLSSAPACTFIVLSYACLGLACSGGGGDTETDTGTDTETETDGRSCRPGVTSSSSAVWMIGTRSARR